MFNRTYATRGLLVALALSAVIAVSAFSPSQRALAQTPSNPAPYNVDLGALITNSLRVAGTVTTNAQANTNWRGVICKFVETVSSGSPSTTFAIQGYDAATASWTTLATSGTSTTSNPLAVLVYPGAVLTTTPTGYVLNSIPLPRTWRLSQTIGNGAGAAGPASTSKIGCNYLL